MARVSEHFQIKHSGAQESHVLTLEILTVPENAAKLPQVSSTSMETQKMREGGAASERLEDVTPTQYVAQLGEQGAQRHLRLDAPACLLVENLLQPAGNWKSAPTYTNNIAFDFLKGNFSIRYVERRCTILLYR